MVLHRTARVIGKKLDELIIFLAFYCTVYFILSSQSSFLFDKFPYLSLEYVTQSWLPLLQRRYSDRTVHVFCFPDIKVNIFFCSNDSYRKNITLIEGK